MRTDLSPALLPGQILSVRCNLGSRRYKDFLTCLSLLSPFPVTNKRGGNDILLRIYFKHVRPRWHRGTKTFLVGADFELHPGSHTFQVDAWNFRACAAPVDRHWDFMLSGNVTEMLEHNLKIFPCPTSWMTHGHPKFPHQVADLVRVRAYSERISQLAISHYFRDWDPCHLCFSPKWISISPWHSTPANNAKSTAGSFGQTYYFKRMISWHC